MTEQTDTGFKFTVGIAIALLMLLSFFLLEWFDAGPLVSIKGYNIVSTLNRINMAFGEGSSSTGVELYYVYFAIPIGAVLGLVRSFKGDEGGALTALSATGVVVIVVTAVLVAMNTDIIQVFGPGLWASVGAAVWANMALTAHKKKLKTDPEAK